ncbi:MAG: TAXI family TRAP transporter solute-binding subunit, partial [Alphaproteobacteria bacterium]
AIEKLKAGEIDGMVYVAGKPTRAFSDISADDLVHFVPIDFEPALLETYLPARLTSQDYPALIEPGEAVDTLAVGAVMAVYNWSPDTYRYRKVSRFVDSFFDQFSKFQEAPRHPKWKEVTLSAEVPGWSRFLPAEEWLEQREFEAYLLEQKSTDIASIPERIKAEVFEQFLLWRTANAQ